MFKIQPCYACVNTLFLYIADNLYFTFCSLVDEHSGCFYLLAVMNNAVMNTHHKFCEDTSFHFFCIDLGVKSYALLLGNCQTLFQSGCIILQSLQHSMRILISPHPANTFDYRHPSECNVESDYAFHLHFSDD